MRQFQQDLVPRSEQLQAQATAQNAALGGLRLDLEALITSTEALANGERDNGALTGSAGSGGVASTLFQIRDKVEGTRDTVQAAIETGVEQLDSGEVCLSDLRGTLRGFDPDTDRLNAASEDIDCLNRTAADLINRDVPSMVESAMLGLTSSIVLPATVRSEAQRVALANTLTSIQAEANRVAAKAANLKRDPVDPLIVDQPNVLVAVAMYWHTIIPAIATAIAIDLLPLVVLILRLLRHRDSVEAGLSPTDWSLRDLADMKKHIKEIQADDARMSGVRVEPFEPDDDWWNAKRLGDDVLEGEDRDWRQS